ncbi:MAG: RDD family protein [Bacilli bacterium]
MNASFKKRLLAYLLDCVFLIIIATIISLFIPINDNVKVLNQELTTIQNNYLKHDIKYTQYFNGSAEIIKDLDQQQIIFYLITAILMIGYFVIWPYYHQGQTMGKKKMQIKIVNNNNQAVTINTLLIRSMIITGLGYMLITMLLVYLLPSQNYYLTISILSFMQMIIIITSGFMILNRANKKGIHDLIVKTKVIEVEK